MIVTQNNIHQDLKIGNKALHLKILSDAGYNVPDFLVIPSNIVDDIRNNSCNIHKLIDEIRTNLNVNKYVVRSSSHLEDNSDSSMAGQFHTEIDVSSDVLEEAIILTIKNSSQQSENSIGDLSLIILEYITADYAGITFTRSPKGSREMVLEYHKGIGEEIVSGQVKPIVEQYYHSQILNSSENKVLKNILQNYKETDKKNIPTGNIGVDFINIENIFGEPMDIEWCIKSGKIYYLQARKITTITDKQYNEIITLETLLEENSSLNNLTKFYYEKNEISEVCSRPTPFMLSLFDKIYSKNGPLDNFYRKNNIFFQYKIPENKKTHVIKIIGNELYSDKQAELESLLPGVSIFENNLYKPYLWNIKGLLKRLKNLYFLFRLKDNKVHLETQVSDLLSKKFLDSDQNSIISIDNFNQALNELLEAYEIIYELNYFTSKAFAQLHIALKKEKISFSEIITLNKTILGMNNLPIFDIDSTDYLGNSININDESIFISQFTQKNSSASEKYWNSLPEWKKNYLRPIVSDAIYYEYLREIGRHITVKYVSHLRTTIKNIDLTLTNKENIYFSTIDEICNKKIDESKVENRKSLYNKCNDYDFPTVISDSYINKKSDSTIGISSGIAEGEFINLKLLKELLEENNFKGDEKIYNKKYILSVTILSPDLTQYFDNITGIITEKGGELSHLAIMAREYKIPIITNFNIIKSSLQNGDIIEINGNNGNITKK